MTEAAENYKVHLDLFEGPLDLLLHLIKKEDLDIYDVPISRLLAGYLEYLRLAQELNIDLAGEFLEMASELTYIKSKMLLPEATEEEEEGPDPRADLIQRLLEYQKYKKAAQSLIARPLLGRDVFARLPQGLDEEPAETWIEADSVSLLSAFQDLLKKLPKEQYHEIQESGLGVAEKILELMETLRGKKQVAFEDLFLSQNDNHQNDNQWTRSELVVTFLAILEMSRQGLMRIFQDPVLRKIHLCPLLISEAENLPGGSL